MPKIGNVRARTNHYTHKEWEDHYQTIKRLYVDEKKTQNEVRQIMEAEYGFVITGSQMKKQLGKWDLAVKNVKLKREEKAALLQLQEGRWALENKTTEFRKWGKQVDPRTLLRFKEYLGNNDVPTADLIDDSASLAGVSYRTPSTNSSYIGSSAIRGGVWKKPRMVDIIAKYMAGLRIRSEKTHGLVLDESNLHQFGSWASNTDLQLSLNKCFPEVLDISHDRGEPGLEIHDNWPLDASSRISPTELLFRECINQDMLQDDSPKSNHLEETGGSTCRSSQSLSSVHLSPVIHEVCSGIPDFELFGTELEDRFLLAVEEVLSQGFHSRKLPKGCVSQALKSAVLCNQSNIVRMLLEDGASPEFQVLYGIWAIQWAVMANQEDMLNILLSARACANKVTARQESLLHMAALRGADGILRKLIMAGVNVDACDEDEQTPLHYATRRDNNTAVMKELIEADVNVNARDLHGNTPLHFAISFSDAAMIRGLLLYGANSDARNVFQQTPMFNVLDSARDVEIAALLLEYGAGVDFRSVNNNTPLHLAMNAGRIDIAAVLLTSGADIATQNSSAETPLSLAVKSGNLELVRLLGEWGADLSELDNIEQAKPPIRGNAGRTTDRDRRHGGTRLQLQPISE